MSAKTESLRKELWEKSYADLPWALGLGCLAGLVSSYHTDGLDATLDIAVTGGLIAVAEKKIFRSEGPMELFFERGVRWAGAFYIGRSLTMALKDGAFYAQNYFS